MLSGHPAVSRAVPGRHDDRALVLPAVRRGDWRWSDCRRATRRHRAGRAIGLTGLLLASSGPGRGAGRRLAEPYVGSQPPVAADLLGIHPLGSGPRACRSSRTSRWSARDSAASGPIHPYFKTQDADGDHGDEQRAAVGRRVGRGRAGPVSRWPASGRSAGCRLLPEAGRLGRSHARLRLDRSGRGFSLWSSCTGRSSCPPWRSRPARWAAPGIAGWRAARICSSTVGEPPMPEEAQGGVDPTMPESTCLHIQDRESGPIRVVEMPWISVRIGRAAYCEVRLPEHDLADDVACWLNRRGKSWHLVPVATGSPVLLEGRPLMAPVCCPSTSPFKSAATA